MEWLMQVSQSLVRTKPVLKSEIVCFRAPLLRAMRRRRVARLMPREVETAGSLRIGDAPAVKVSQNEGTRRLRDLRVLKDGRWMGGQVR